MSDKLREALVETEHDLSLFPVDGIFAQYGINRILANIRAALSAPDDGWVKVDEEHPLPEDLQVGDEILLSKNSKIEGVINAAHGARRRYYVGGEWVRVPTQGDELPITHYRRTRKE